MQQDGFFFSASPKSPHESVHIVIRFSSPLLKRDNGWQRIQSAITVRNRNNNNNDKIAKPYFEELVWPLTYKHTHTQPIGQAMVVYFLFVWR